MIDNGEATIINKFSDKNGVVFVIEYKCNTGYHYSLNHNKLSRACVDGNMLSKPPPCER